MRVLIDYRPALRGRSGAGEYTHELAAALIARSAAGGCGKVEISLFSSSWKDRLTVAPELSGVTPIDLRIPVAVLNLAWHRLGWPGAEMLTGRTFDVTHSSHPLLLPARAAAQVVTIHDLDFLSHPERTRAEIRRDYPVLARRHAQRADAVIVPSRFTAGEVERLLDVEPGRIAVCPPGAPDWSPRTRAPRSGYLLFFGTLEPRKNVGGLLDAYERLLETRKGRDAKGAGAVPELVLAGRATSAADPWLARLTRPPLFGHARHIGYVAPDQRRALYEGARLLVLPSLDEGFGIPVLEAMTVGVPVVASRRGALPEVLGGAGVLIDPLDAADLAAGLARLLDDEGFAASCVTHGLARAGAYRWTDTAARVCEAYHQAITHRARQQGSS
jgi:glycosyltransferase involved in cell wall biosynthesis